MPMMYMDDAIAATIYKLKEEIKIHSSYNLAVSLHRQKYSRNQNIFRIHDYLQTRLPPENDEAGLQY
jgi:hypothetical protein